MNAGLDALITALETAPPSTDPKGRVQRANRSYFVGEVVFIMSHACIVTATLPNEGEFYVAEVSMLNKT